MRIERINTITTLVALLISCAALAQPDAAAINRLAADLAVASPEHRAALMESQKGLVSPELFNAIFVQSQGLMDKGKPADALSLDEFALELAIRTNDTYQEELCYQVIGWAQFAVGRTEASLESFRKSLAMAELRKDTARGARVAFDISTNYRNLGDYPSALRYGSIGLEMAQAAGKPLLEAMARNAMATVHAEIGRYGEALAQFLKGLAICEQIKSESCIGYISNNIGETYARQGDVDLARRYYLRAAQVMEKSKDSELSSTYSNLADLEIKQGRPQDAMTLAQRGLAQAMQFGKKKQIIESEIQLAKVERAIGQFAASLEHLRAADEAAQEAHLPDHHLIALLDMAGVNLDSGKLGQALEQAQAAAAGARELGDDATLGRALELAATVSFRSGKRPAARQYALDAIQVYDRIRDDAAGNIDDRAMLFDATVAPYRLLARMDADAGHAEAAFEATERVKSQALAEVMNRPSAGVWKSMTKAEQARERALRLAVSRAVAGSAKTVARLDHRAFLNELYITHPDLRFQRGRTEPVPAKQIVSTLDRGTVLMEYLVEAEATLLFVATREHGIRLFRIKLSQQALRTKVEAYRRMVATRDLDYREAAVDLYRALLEPAKQELTGKLRLVILPDGPLWTLPFQALISSDTRFLGETVAVSYAPSATIWAGLAMRPRKENARVLALSYELPEAEVEVQAMGPLYGKDVRILTGTAAREATFKAEAAGYGVLHLASHGVLDDASPLYSYIALASGGDDDGKLEAAELLNMTLQARLAVLSACDTAGGRVTGGEGVLGLTWALAVAGVPATIASGWKVDSKSTAELMIQLHRGLQAKLDPADALRQAARSLMNRPATRHPFYWAGFAVYGR